MRKLVIAAGLVAMSSGGAMAAACPVQTVTVDATSVSALLSGFIASFGNSASCTFSFSAPTDHGTDVFAIYTANYRLGSLDEDTARVTINRNGGTFTSTKTFDNTYTYTLDDVVGKNADGTIGGTASIDVLTEITPGSSDVELESLDYTEFATMTRTQANASLNQINLASVGLITHLDGMNGLLTGGNLPVEGDNEVGTFGAVGSYDFGAHGRFNLAEGFSVLGGVSIFDFASTNATARGFGGAVAIRYLDPNPGQSRLLVEGGLDANSLSAVSFTRTYNYTQTGTAKTATVIGTGTGSTAGIYGKAGVLWSVDQSNEVLVSATLKQSMLGIATYTETFSAANNPFPANLAGSQTMFTTARAGADWTTHLTSDVDLTASAGIGTTFANGGTTAVVFGGGSATGAAQSTIFADYGVRLGWKPSQNFGVDGFLHGTTGTGIGTHLQAGVGARLTF